MSKPSLVSVVIIFWNSEKFIREAIESVFDQTYTDWELLLIDDGSRDNSTNIAKKYAVKFPGKVFYITHHDYQNHGKSASRNLGIQNASGKYIAFLDSDDVWVSNILEEQVAILETHPSVAMVYGPIQWWYSWTGKPEDIGRDYIEYLGVPPDTIIPPPNLLTLFLQNKAAVPSDILLRREIIEHVGGFEEEFKELYEDQVFYVKVCLVAPVFAAGKCWYRYRQHPDSSCSRAMATGEYFTSRPIFLNWLERYMSKQKYKDAALWQALCKEQWPYRHPVVYRLLKIVLTRSEILAKQVRLGKALHFIQHAEELIRYRSF
jgi:glycosyltransferase involved in cell wall biosynthesis